VASSITGFDRQISLGGAGEAQGVEPVYECLSSCNARMFSFAMNGALALSCILSLSVELWCTEGAIMTDPLAAESLMTHIRTLAGEIGPRPTGQSAENQARAYIRQMLE
jgi:hypothetical protein